MSTHQELLRTLKERFEKNMRRHEGVSWETVRSRLLLCRARFPGRSHRVVVGSGLGAGAECKLGYSLDVPKFRYRRRAFHDGAAAA